MEIWRPASSRQFDGSISEKREQNREYASPVTSRPAYQRSRVVLVADGQRVVGSGSGFKTGGPDKGMMTLGLDNVQYWRKEVSNKKPRGEGGLRSTQLSAGSRQLVVFAG